MPQAKASFRWLTPPGDVIVRLNGYDLALVDGIRAIFQMFRSQAEAMARQIAPWQDRSGDARAGLGAEVEDGGRSWALTVFHTVFYGIFLEFGTRFMGPYPAVMPTIEQIQGRLMAAIRALVGG